jgi:hypothetical protein
MRDERGGMREGDARRGMREESDVDRQSLFSHPSSLIFLVILFHKPGERILRGRNI